MKYTLLLLACWPFLVGCKQSNVHTILNHSLVRIQPTQKPPGIQTSDYFAARNEWLGFQIIVTAGKQNLNNVDIVAGDLKGPDGATIAAPKLYREHYIQVTKSTPNSPEDPGWWPDALIPIRPAPDEKLAGNPIYAGAPFNVESGHNQPIYADIYVPVNAAAGLYHGNLTVSAIGETDVTLEYSLTVWNFAIRQKPACVTCFSTVTRAMNYEKLKEGTPEYTDIHGRYTDLLIQNRILPTMPYESIGVAKPDGTPDMKTAEPALLHYFNDLHGHAIYIHIPFADPGGVNRAKTIKYLKGVSDYLADHHWDDLMYVYLVDEPNSKEAYDKIRNLSAMVHEANPKIKFMTTKQPGVQDKTWGSLVGSVDIWCPLWCKWNADDIQDRLKNGDVVWSYTALTQGKEPTPYWELDFPLLNYRVCSWQNWLSGSTGLLYWNTVKWDATPDPWTIPANYKGYNGEGSLIYPGASAGVKGGVASLRLKAIRDGLQDYEYCVILASRKGRAAAEPIVKRVARSWFDWDKNPETLLAVRKSLAEAIMAP